MKKVLVLNGPKLNLLGTREPAVYGADTLADVERLCRQEGEKLGVEIDSRTTRANPSTGFHEAGREIAAGNMIGIVFKPGAFTHMSVALHDRSRGPTRRSSSFTSRTSHASEEFRHHSSQAQLTAAV